MLTVKNVMAMVNILALVAMVIILGIPAQTVTVLQRLYALNVPVMGLFHVINAKESARDIFGTD